MLDGTRHLNTPGTNSKNKKSGAKVTGQDARTNERCRGSKGKKTASRARTIFLRHQLDPTLHVLQNCSSVPTKLLEEKTGLFWLS